MLILLENIKYLCNSLSNYFHDYIYGVETMQEVQVYDLGVFHENIKHAKKYQATNYSLLKKIFKQLDIDYTKYTFYDIGAGKGRALFVSSLYPFIKCIGLEFGQTVYQSSEKNLESFKLSKDNISVKHNCASAENYLDSPCIYFMYNPFDEILMKKFLEKIKKAKNSKDIIIYVNPRKTDDFLSFGWRRYKAIENRNYNRVVHFYNCSR